MVGQSADANWRTRLSPHGKLLTLVVLLTVVPLLAIAALGWRILRDTRAVESGASARLEADGARVVTALRDAIDAWVTLAAHNGGGDAPHLPVNTTLLVLDGTGVRHIDGGRLPYVPAVSSYGAPSRHLFHQAEALEFRTDDRAGAIREYQRLERSADPDTRALALMRHARLLRKQPKDALAVYNELLAMGDTRVDGDPAELVARRERIALLDASGDHAASLREASLLAQLLTDGRFLIERTTYDFYTQPLPIDSALRPRVEAILADTLMTYWPLFLRATTDHMTGNLAVGRFAIVWTKRSDGTTGALAGPVEQLVAATPDAVRAIPFSLQGPSGDSAWGSLSGPLSGETRTVVDPSLPWTLHVGQVEDQGAREALSSTNRVLAAGSAVVFVAILAASALAFRAVRRELEVARLQSEFVAAVSHEFRTPLAALCHLSELLEEGTPPDRHPHYFRALSRESGRLRVMVENLLDFGRMEAGRRRYTPVPIEIADVVSEVAQQCREQIPTATERLDVVGADASPSQCRVNVDRPALVLALRNLVENALKYSPDISRVTVSTSVTAGQVGVSIADRGPGIPVSEQRQVFHKFVRGSAAHDLNVKGTGIGLTMAHDIVKAHGGRLDLVSVLGHGSCFTVRLPLFVGRT
jgi:two-component system phosphate regulon sensor histidine kinase PhoR